MATRTGIGRGTTSGGDLFDDHDSPRLQTNKPGRQSHRPEELDSDAKRGSYATFYNALRELRKVFHRIGQFNDANAKLDEMCKLLVLRVLDARHPPASATTRLSLDYLKQLAKIKCGNPRRIAAAIHEVFSEITAKFPDEIEAFGPRPCLNMSPDDDAFASALVPLLESLPVADSANLGRWALDSLNEAFGHFIQDSFRNRKEDAQYMTAPEVVSEALEIAFIDILNFSIGQTARRQVEFSRDVIARGHGR